MRIVVGKVFSFQLRCFPCFFVIPITSFTLITPPALSPSIVSLCSGVRWSVLYAIQVVIVVVTLYTIISQTKKNKQHGSAFSSPQTLAVFFYFHCSQVFLTLILKSSITIMCSSAGPPPSFLLIPAATVLEIENNVFVERALSVFAARKRSAAIQYESRVEAPTLCFNSKLCMSQEYLLCFRSELCQVRQHCNADNNYLHNVEQQHFFYITKKKNTKTHRQNI